MFTNVIEMTHYTWYSIKNQERDVFTYCWIKTHQVVVMTSFMFFLPKDSDMDITMCYKEFNCLLDICYCCKIQKNNSVLFITN